VEGNILTYPHRETQNSDFFYQDLHSLFKGLIHSTESWESNEKSKILQSFITNSQILP